MAKKKWSSGASETGVQDKPATLKDLLSPDVVAGLKAQADKMKAEEQARKDAARAEAEAARKAEEKRLENDFGHLLEKSNLDWRKHK
ncbi:YqkE family protein [Paenibacillus sp. GCM10023248]|uniref:YqkE family protein n=1 Tax=Bacillales TaxID=1385 RepID=UPI002378913C|nr:MULTISPECIES: YqkE family protein [Bacillales]MDD9266909.1 YqkE family protein [Paenibacillus sp. MAHUQ-63]MDR6881107.1 membrane protein involved in colicin uptake [Bacillus sp. 3255]